MPCDLQICAKANPIPLAEPEMTAVAPLRNTDAAIDIFWDGESDRGVVCWMMGLMVAT
jgi:hypothetical protein